jgi:hypothetical protein
VQGIRHEREKGYAKHTRGENIGYKLKDALKQYSRQHTKEDLRERPKPE